MKTKLVRPILIESKEKTELWSYKGRRLYYDQANFNDKDDPIYYQLILVSLDSEEKIEVGTEVACFEDKELNDFVGLSKVEEYYNENQAWCYDENDKSMELPLNYQFFVRKVIATQSQLSPEYISKFVKEYNSGGMNDFEIEMEKYWYTVKYPSSGMIDEEALLSTEKPKLTLEGYITIVEEALFTCTKQDLKDIFDSGHAYATGTHKDLEQVNPDFEEWFAKNKKKYQQENN